MGMGLELLCSSSWEFHGILVRGPMILPGKDLQVKILGGECLMQGAYFLLGQTRFRV